MSQTTTRPYRYWMQVGCANGHITETPVLNATVESTPEGDMVSGACGSDADFCKVCDAEVETLAVLDRGHGEV